MVVRETDEGGGVGAAREFPSLGFCHPRKKERKTKERKKERCTGEETPLATGLVYKNLYEE